MLDTDWIPEVVAWGSAVISRFVMFRRRGSMPLQIRPVPANRAAANSMAR